MVQCTGGRGLIFLLSLFTGVIEHMLRHRERIWLTRPGGICRFIEGRPAGIVPGGEGL